jgi:hypothetical protein
MRRIPTVSDALPGRVDYLTLWPLTQGEIAGRRELLPPHLLDRSASGSGPSRCGRSGATATPNASASRARRDGPSCACARPSSRTSGTP